MRATATGAPARAVRVTGYLFWDDVHPTTAAHQIIADEAHRAVTATPEPTSLLLFATGALGAAVVAWGRKRGKARPERVEVALSR